MLKSIKRWYKRTFVECRLEWRWWMLHEHWEAEQRARDDGWDFVRVPDHLLIQM